MNLIDFVKNGIRRDFFVPRTLQQNGAEERNNRNVIQMARTMLKDANLGNVYWKEVVHTVVYIPKRGQIRVKHTKIPNELQNGRPTMKYFKFFGSKCYIRRDEDDLGKFDTIYRICYKQQGLSVLQKGTK